MKLAQVIADTVIWGSEIGLIAMGMSLSYSILGFANFAHIDLLTFGAYMTWVGNRLLGLPLALAIPLSFVATGLLAIGIDRGVFRQIRQAPAALKMIASVGVGIVLRSLLTVIFTSDTQGFGFSYLASYTILGARLTSLEILIIIFTLILMGAFHGLLSWTKIGWALRATADNLELAQTRGIDAEKMISLMWFVSGAFAAAGGTMLGLETQVQPPMGLTVLIPVFSAVTLGGLGSAYGAIGGAFLVALAQSVASAANFGALVGKSWFLPINDTPMVALAILILTLFLRPAGLFARKDR